MMHVAEHMRKKKPAYSVALLILLLFLVCLAETALSREKKLAAPDKKTTASALAPVVFDHKTLFEIYAPVLSFSPQERAKFIEERIRKLAGDPLARKDTEHILAEPAPFVLQTALDDFYVCYQLNAYTNHPKMMAVIYSELHQNNQDKSNDGGVEIMSPIIPR